VKYERRTNTPVCSIEMEQSQRKLRIWKKNILWLTSITRRNKSTFRFDAS
jgi:hypothetical protein